MMARTGFRSHPVKGSVNLKSSLALGCCLMTALLLTDLILQSRNEQAPAVRCWQLTDFLDHLQNGGVQLHVLWGTTSPSQSDYAYLTEDPDATRLSMMRKSRTIESIHQWQGVVWVGHRPTWEDMEAELNEWGPNGCRIDNLFLFGDAHILRRIQGTCR